MNKKIKCENFLNYTVVIYVTLLIASNIMGSKLIGVPIPFEIYGVGKVLILDAAVIIFPLTYMIGDLISEVFGFKTAKKIILLGFAANLLFAVFTLLGTLLPGINDESGLTGSYNTLFSYAPRILVASFAAYLFGSLINAKTLLIIKKLTKSRFFWVRSIGSTFFGAIIDTAIFTVIAWAGEQTLPEMLNFFIMGVVVKMLYEIIIATPLDYAILSFIKKFVTLP